MAKYICKIGKRASPRSEAKAPKIHRHLRLSNDHHELTTQSWGAFEPHTQLICNFTHFGRLVGYHFHHRTINKNYSDEIHGNCKAFEDLKTLQQNQMHSIKLIKSIDFSTYGHDSE